MTAGGGAYGVRRFLVVCAVLAGLFLMHGAPASANSACHGGGSHLTAMGRATAPLAHHAPVITASHDAGTCLATPARGSAPPAGWAAPAVLATGPLALGAGRLTGTGSRRLRGPPGGGRELLSRVCVART